MSSDMKTIYVVDADISNLTKAMRDASEQLKATGVVGVKAFQDITSSINEVTTAMNLSADDADKFARKIGASINAMGGQASEGLDRIEKSIFSISGARTALRPVYGYISKIRDAALDIAATSIDGSLTAMLGGDKTVTLMDRITNGIWGLREAFGKLMATILGVDSTYWARDVIDPQIKAMQENHRKMEAMLVGVPTGSEQEMLDARWERMEEHRRKDERREEERAANERKRRVEQEIRDADRAAKKMAAEEKDRIDADVQSYKRAMAERERLTEANYRLSLRRARMLKRISAPSVDIYSAGTLSKSQQALSSIGVMGGGAKNDLRRQTELQEDIAELDRQIANNTAKMAVNDYGIGFEIL